MADFEDPAEHDSETPEAGRDAMVDEAKIVLMDSLFDKEPEEVFYQRQIEVMYEDQFYHWITTKALKELAEEARLRTEVMRLSNRTEVRFYWPAKTRYYTRKRKEILKLIGEHSQITEAVGAHGEMMFDAALPREGFIPTARDVRAYQGRQWIQSAHNLDRIIERDGIAYGVEIKNTMAYIPRDEMRIKLDLCDYLGLRPLFIMRFAPKSYVEEIRRRGGFSLLFKWQFLPHGFTELAQALKNRLRLPVDCPRRVEDGTIHRFLRWHLRALPPTTPSP